MDLTNIHRILHSNSTEYTFYLATHGSFSKIDHILRQKINLKNCRKSETALGILPGSKTIKLELNRKDFWELNKLIEIQQCITE